MLKLEYFILVILNIVLFNALIVTNAEWKLGLKDNKTTKTFLLVLPFLALIPYVNMVSFILAIGILINYSLEKKDG